MKWMIASDIHGSAKYCRLLLEDFLEEGADKLLLLGDILYHGPRNALPEEYAPMDVAHMLNAFKDQIICVRGNCDAEVDQMVLNFPITADYAVVDINGKTCLATHGHVYGEEKLPEGVSPDYVFAGHTHVPVKKAHEGYVFMNPGSVSIPKEASGHSYLIMDENSIHWKQLDRPLRCSERMFSESAYGREKLYEKRKNLLDYLLDKGAISSEQYEAGIFALKEALETAPEDGSCC